MPDGKNYKGRRILPLLLPFVLTLIIITSDRITKNLVIKTHPAPDGRVISDVFNNGLVEIIHVRNNVIAFSLGGSLPMSLRPVLFIVFPSLVLCFLVFFYFYSAQWTRLERIALAMILGGGTGNIIDRIFPPGGINGVVDFLSVKFFGIFGLERWPTFNIADASVVIGVFIWILSILIVKKENLNE